MVEGNNGRWMVRALAGGVIGWILVLTTQGCTDMQAVHSFRADAQALRQSLDAKADRRQHELDTLPPDDPARPLVLAEKAQAEAAAAVVDAGLARLDEVLAEAAKPSDPFTETVGAATPLLPLPLRGPLLLGTAAAVLGLRAWRLKAGLASVARGLSVAMREDEEFRTCFGKHADTFRATQTPTAKRVIDQVTRDRPAQPMVGLPI